VAHPFAHNFNTVRDLRVIPRVTLNRTGLVGRCGRGNQIFPEAGWASYYENLSHPTMDRFGRVLRAASPTSVPLLPGLRQMAPEPDGDVRSRSMSRRSPFGPLAASQSVPKPTVILGP